MRWSAACSVIRDKSSPKLVLRTCPPGSFTDKTPVLFLSPQSHNPLCRDLHSEGDEDAEESEVRDRAAGG